MRWLLLLALFLRTPAARASADDAGTSDAGKAHDPVLASFRDPAHPETGRWKDRSLDPWATTDITAYTIPKKHFRVGLFNQDYGVLSNTQIGTSLLLWVVTVPNAHAKITAIQTPRFDAAFDAGWYGLNLERVLHISGGHLDVVPLGWRASWIVSRRTSLHFGTAWMLADVKGSLTPTQLGNVLDNAFGINVSDLVVQVMGQDSSVYAGANLALSRLRLAMDYRLNRRDSVILTLGSYITATGLVGAGYQTDVGNNGTADVGSSVRVTVPLYQQVPGTLTVCYQLTWEHWQVRVGLPFASTGFGFLFGLPQAFTVAAEF